MKNNLKSIIEDKTVVIITHKPSILALVDRLIVVEDGKIVANGPKNEVIAMFNKQKNNTGKVNKW